MFKNFKIFQIAAVGILVVFMGLMVLVTIVAYSRTSGHTGLDMGKIQQIRSAVTENK